MTTVHRLVDWPTRLEQYLQACARLSFAWGLHDCARFAAGAVQAITGTAVPLPAWHDHRSALRAVRRLGGLDVAVSEVLPRLPSPAMAQRGDLLLVPAALPGEGPALAICLGHAWAAPAAVGLNYGDPACAIAAWRVG
jgi:hypothetical protein